MIKLSTLAKEHLLLLEGTVKNTKAMQQLIYWLLDDIAANFLKFKNKDKFLSLYRKYATDRSKVSDAEMKKLGLRHVRSRPIGDFLDKISNSDFQVTDDFLDFLKHPRFGSCYFYLEFISNSPAIAGYDPLRVQIYFNVGDKEFTKMIANKVGSDWVDGIVHGKYRGATWEVNEIKDTDFTGALRSPKIVTSMMHEMQHLYNNSRIKDWKTRMFPNRKEMIKNFTKVFGSEISKEEAITSAKSAMALYLDEPDEIWARTQEAVYNMYILSEEEIDKLNTSAAYRKTYLEDVFVPSIYNPDISGPEYGNRSKEVPEYLKRRLAKVFTQVLGDIIEDRKLNMSTYRMKRGVPSLNYSVQEPQNKRKRKTNVLPDTILDKLQRFFLRQFPL